MISGRTCAFTAHLHQSSRSGSRSRCTKRLRNGLGIAKWTPRSDAGLPAAMTTQKPTIVLVHGAFAESASWNGVIASLQERGVTAIAAANPLRSLSGDAAYVRDVIASVGGPVILVGHSYGGLVITEAAAANDAVVGLVYVCAFVPETGQSAFEPFANLAYVDLSTDGFTEQGGAAALTAGSGDAGITYTTLGLRASTMFAVGNGMTATARGTVGWVHAFGDTTPITTFAFGGGSAFDIAGVPIASDAALLEAGAERELAQALAAALADGAPLIAARDYVGLLGRLAALREPVDRYFDAVMVMVDDAPLRANRLSLLARLRNLFLTVADISLLPAA